MLKTTLRTAILVLAVSLLTTGRAQAQAHGPGASRRATAENSSTSGMSRWWDGQIRSFKHRWHLPGSSNKTAPASKKMAYSKKSSPPRKKPVGHVNRQNGVRLVSFQSSAPAAGPVKGLASVQPAVASTGSKPADPATAGLVPGYPQFHGSLYPSPRPDIPYQVGGTAVTNQAFAPHEMLYPHSYRALYPPFYYKVRGGWMVTPWGVWSHDKWELEGTEVKVKYRPRISVLSGFSPPVLR